MTSNACCSLPAISVEYLAKGQYETLGGVRTYVVGESDSAKVIVDIYDIFGIWPQTLQGADRLAAHTKALVLVPDFFDGKGLSIDVIPTDTDEKKKEAQDFFATTGNLQSNFAKLLDIRKAIAQRWPAAEEHCGVFGLCWGGKLAVMAGGDGNHGPGRYFKATGTAHPGLLDEKDAKAQTVPHILLASKDEPAGLVKAYEAIMGDRGEVRTYETMHHGWMGARADLADEDNAAQFEDGYIRAAEFFLKCL